MVNTTTPKSTSHAEDLISYSEAWAQPEPPTASEGVAMLNTVWAQLSRRDQQMRNIAYQRLAAFILSRPPVGVTAYYPGSWSNPGISGKIARLDLEVISGSAFLRP